MMIEKALGLLETYGYIGAIEATDACLKVADVELIGLEFVGGGLVTIKICGDVSAVKASIDAGAAAAKRMGKVISIDVIARMGEGLEKIIYMPQKDKEIRTEVQNEITRCDEIAKESETYAINEPRKWDAIEAEELKAVEEDMNSPYDGDIIQTALDENTLINMKVVDLRRIARSVDGISIEKSEIKFAKKSELIEALTNCFNKEVE